MPCKWLDILVLFAECAAVKDRNCSSKAKDAILTNARLPIEKLRSRKFRLLRGQHGQSRKKVSNYGMQLREKQKVRRYYGLLEKQFAKYYEMADRKQGMTGPNLLSLCESRLDNVVYRLGLASSRAEARQLVVHGHYTVNGKRVNIPSFLVHEGDVIAVCEKSRTCGKIQSCHRSELGSSGFRCGWIQSGKDGSKSCSYAESRRYRLRSSGKPHRRILFEIIAFNRAVILNRMARFFNRHGTKYYLQKQFCTIGGVNYMIEIEKPRIETAEMKPDGTYGKFILGPLERGYGTTLGNSLRRVLLSSLPGVAVASIKIGRSAA